MSNIEQLRSAIKDVLAKGIAEAQGERIHVIGECQDCRWWEAERQHRHGRDRSAGPVLAECRENLILGLFGDEYPVETPSDFGCVQWEAKT